MDIQTNVGELSPPADGAHASPVGDDSHAAHRDERNRRLLRSFFSGFLSKPLASVISFVSVPLFLSYLLPERNGMYEAIIGLPAWLSLANVGFTYALVNQLTDCHVRDDRLLARKYVSSLFFPLVALTLVLVLLATAAVPVISWQRFFPTNDPAIRAEIPRVVWVTAVITFLSFLITVPGAVYTAYQELDRSNYWDAAAKVLTLAGCFAIVHTRLGLLGVALVMVGTPAFVRLVNTVTLLTFEKPWLRPKLEFFDKKVLFSSATDSASLLLLQCATLAIFQSDKFIIMWARGGAEVTIFATVGRLFVLAYGAYTLISGPLWPAYGESIRRGDMVWVRKTLRRCIAIGCAAMLICGLSLFTFGDQFMRLWTRGQIQHCPRALVVPITLMFIARILAECPSVVLNSANIIRPQLILLGTNAVLNVAMGMLLAKRFGVVGVAWTFPITAAVTTLWGYPWLLRRYFGKAMTEQADRR